jgi:uncharacterized protein DUF6544
MLVATLSGIVAALLIALLVASAAGSRRFRNRYAKEKADLIERARAGSPPAQAADLPPPVQRYLETTRGAYNPRLEVATLRQRGTLRAAADKPWIPFEAEQLYSIEPPAFIWLANARMASVVPLLARDKFVDGKGNMLPRWSGAPIYDGHRSTPSGPASASSREV